MTEMKWAARLVALASVAVALSLALAAGTILVQNANGSSISVTGAAQKLSRTGG